MNSLTSLYFYCFKLREEGNLKGNSRKRFFMILQIVWFNISYHKSCCKSNKFTLLMYFVQSLHIFLQFVSYLYVQRNFLSYFPIENDLNWRGFAKSWLRAIRWMTIERYIAQYFFHSYLLQACSQRYRWWKE